MLQEARLSCPVRGCALPLAAASGGVACERGHRFDRARGGSLNLLQPDQRRSREPGDTAEAVVARERLAERGLDRALRITLQELVADQALDASAALLELGCGVGTLLQDLAAVTDAERFGMDLSAPAARAAARRARPATCLVANADYRLPFLTASLTLALSIKAPRPLGELARILRPGGRLLLGLPTRDDLLELRAATAGAGLARDPLEVCLASLPVELVAEQRLEVRERWRLAASDLQDLLAISYRGQRLSESRRAAQVADLDVTLGTHLLICRRC
jgi:23S rRNA (guanine745-N1)-methyltransferase